MADRVVGRIPVLECLRARRRSAKHLFLLRDAEGMDDILGLAADLPVTYRSRRELDQLSAGVVHQGVILEAAPLPVLDVKGWLEREKSQNAVAVVLDGVEDPHNFGAIVRSASALGACAVVFGKDRSAPISPAAVKSAAGAMEYIDLVEAGNLSRALDAMKKAEFWIAGFEADAEKTLWDADLKGRIALVVGSEGKGMRRLVREHCDFVLRIPLVGAITSLNASVSAALALAECRRQRQTTV